MHFPEIHLTDWPTPCKTELAAEMLLLLQICLLSFTAFNSSQLPSSLLEAVKALAKEAGRKLSNKDGAATACFEEGNRGQIKITEQEICRLFGECFVVML